MAYRPNGEEVAVSTLDGQITFFYCKTSQQIGSIEGRNDLGSGRSDTDLITAKKSLQGKYVSFILGSFHTKSHKIELSAMSSVHYD